LSDTPAGDPIGFEVDGDIAEAETTQIEGAEEALVDDAPSRQYVEVDDPDNRWDRVKVDGQDVEVTVAEMRRGYSREADYTRKAQELARQREEAEYGIRLQQAFKANPQATIRFLAEQAGVPLGQQQQAPVPEEDQYVDPLERDIAIERNARLALEQRLAQRDMDEHVERTLNGLRQQFNANDEDIREVVAVAMQNNYPVESLPMIYKAMTLDKLQARFQAQQAAQAQKEAETARRTAAKANASTAVSARPSAQGNGLTDQVRLQERPSIRDAALAAFDELERRH